jgi:hypothetical protein
VPRPQCYHCMCMVSASGAISSDAWVGEGTFDKARGERGERTKELNRSGEVPCSRPTDSKRQTDRRMEVQRRIPK